MAEKRRYLIPAGILLTIVVFFEVNLSQPVFAKQSSLYLEKSFDKLDLYKISDEHFLPLFYIPRNINYSNEDINILLDMVSFKEQEIRDGLYIGDNAMMDTKNAKDIGRIFLSGKCVRCDYSEEVEIELPPVRFLPDSIFYPLISWKEKQWEKKIKNRNDLSQIIDLDLGFASKRLAETKKLVGKEKSEEKIRETMERYDLRIKDISHQLKEIEKEDGNINEVVLQIGDYLTNHKEVLRELLIRTFGNKWIKDTLWEVDDFLVEIKSKQWKSENGVRRYTFNVPKETEYEFFIKSEKVEDYFTQNPLGPVVFELDGKLATKPGELRDDGWILVDKVNLEKGKHKLSVIMPEAKNLVETESLFLEQEKEGRNTAFLPINNFDNTGLYRISFDYRNLRKKSAKFMLIRDTDKKDEKLERIKHGIEIYLHGEVSPQTFETIFRPDYKAKKVELGFIFDADQKEKSVFEIEKIRVERVWSPKIILRSVVGDTEEVRPMPNITFRRTNSTKYELEIEGTKEPYTLIFLESFHKEWKAYVQTSDFKPQSHDNIIASYFDGEIKEREHKNILLDRNTFETWGKKPIPEKRHFLVNGYANSWYITPEDSEGKENYRLIIEFWPQRLFPIGLAVSLLTLLIFLGYLGRFLVKDRRLWKD